MGVYGFPMERAARIGAREVLAFRGDHYLPEKVTLVCFHAAALRTWRTAHDEAI